MKFHQFQILSDTSSSRRICSLEEWWSSCMPLQAVSALRSFSMSQVLQQLPKPCHVFSTFEQKMQIIRMVECKRTDSTKPTKSELTSHLSAFTCLFFSLSSFSYFFYISKPQVVMDAALSFFAFMCGFMGILFNNRLTV